MIHNEIKAATSLSRALRRFIGVEDQESGVERLGETLSPSLDVFGSYVPDLDFLLDRKRLGMLATSGAAVGNQSYVLLGNTSNDLLLMILQARSDAIANYGLATNIAAIWTGAADLGNIGVCMDSRYRLGTGHLVGQANTRTGNDPAPAYNRFGQRPGQTIWDVPVIVGPGEAFIAVGQAANTAIATEVQWIERKLLPGERGKFGVGS